MPQRATVLGSVPGGEFDPDDDPAEEQAPSLSAEQEAAPALTPSDEPLRLPFVSPEQLTSPQLAYAIAKRANHLRVQAASGPWGERDARVNAIGPGVISTPRGQHELASDHGQAMRAMINASGTGRRLHNLEPECSANPTIDS